MKHFVYLLMIAGALSITACATTETSDESDQGSATEATSAAPAEATQSQASTEAATEEAAPAESAPAATEAQSTTTGSSPDGSDITYVCTHDGNTRTIRVIYPDEGPNACEVTYEKSTGTQTLWNASNDSSYCEGKAVDFVAKQEGWGWQCNQQ